MDLDDAGHNDVPETWEEMIEMAMDVESETDETGFTSSGAQATGTGQVVYGATAQSGGSFYDHDGEEWSVEIDSPTSLFAHLWMASFQEEWDIAPGGWAGMDGTDAEQLYREGNAAFMINSGDAANEMIDDGDDVADVTELDDPGGPMGTNSAFMGGSCLSVFDSDYTEHDADDDLSLSFVEYMTLPTRWKATSTGNAELPPRSRSTGGDSAVYRKHDRHPRRVDPDPPGSGRTERPVRHLRPRAERAVPRRSRGIDGRLLGRDLRHSGADDDPKEAVVDMANQVRESVDDEVDYDVEENTDEPELEDVPDELQDWISGDNGTPQIWNPTSRWPTDSSHYI